MLALPSQCLLGNGSDSGSGSGSGSDRKHGTGATNGCIFLMPTAMDAFIGARMVATALHELRRTDKKLGIVSMCIGTGMGAAAVIEAE